MNLEYIESWTERFHQLLLPWYQLNARGMPWRETRAPYLIWISEIMLQQTRVDQVRPYFDRFIQHFPTLETLASANLDEVLLQWEGLGYYSRARNLHKAAQKIVSEHKGVFPSAYKEVINLPGIGPYTASAILSIAFGQPYACLDGNIIRVLTRLLCINDEVNLGSTRKSLQAIADTLLFKNDPSSHNQAMMELGATICLPRSPSCGTCPVNSFCCAFSSDMPENFPKKKKKAAVPKKYFIVAILLNSSRKFMVQQRPPEGLLGGMWELPTIEHKPDDDPRIICAQASSFSRSTKVEILGELPQVSHAYSHFKIQLTPFVIRYTSSEITPESFRWVTLEEAEDLAIHRAHRRVINSYQKSMYSPSLFD